jgi:HSP20 family molecular chaperone IbpA
MFLNIYNRNQSRNNLWADLDMLQEELANSFFKPSFTNATSELKTKEKESFSPPVNIYEQASETILVVDLPGVDEKGVDISFEKDTLIIKGDPTYTVPEEYKIVHREFLLGQYVRKFTINKPIDLEKVSAVIKNGRVTLHLPYTTLNSKKIEVKTF